MRQEPMLASIRNPDVHQHLTVGSPRLRSGDLDFETGLRDEPDHHLSLEVGKELRELARHQADAPK